MLSAKFDENKNLEKIIFTRTFNPNHVINLSKLPVVLKI